MFSGAYFKLKVRFRQKILFQLVEVMCRSLSDKKLVRNTTFKSDSGKTLVRKQCFNKLMSTYLHIGLLLLKIDSWENISRSQSLSFTVSRTGCVVEALAK